MSSKILDLLLYNQKSKNIINKLLDEPLFIKNPVYLNLQHKQIEKVTRKYGKTPFSLRIENTNACNARCFMCPHSTMKRKQGFMDKNFYCKIIDEASLIGINYINLHNFGEPLLDKDFIWRVRYAKQKGIKRISTNTNAQSMDKFLSKQIITSGLDELFVSIDAATEKTYQKIRIGLDFKKVTDNVKYLIKTKKKLKVEKPRVIVDFLDNDLNHFEMRRFVVQWKKIADQVCISKIHDWSAKKRNLTDEKYKNYVSFSHAPCRLPFTEMLVNWDGTVSLCCQDIEGEVLVGDIRNQTLSRIWQGEKINQIREKHLKLKTENLVLCKDCKLRTFWWTF